MAIPPWLWIGTPLKLVLWLFNRLVTSTGLIYMWQHARSRRLLWLWSLVISLVSLAGLALLFYWLFRMRIE